nr:MAG: RNA-dependent RNA polymerase [brine shrimp orbivirus 1]
MVSRSKVIRDQKLDSLFLDIIEVNEKSVTHRFLMDRCQEGVRYGIIGVVDYLRFYASVFEDSIILRNVSYLIDKYPVPFKETKNNTVLSEVSGFYTLPSTFACLLEGLEICFTICWDQIILKNKPWTRSDIEIWTIRIAVSPKVCIKAIRGFVAIIAQLGSMGNVGEVLVYENGYPVGWEPEWSDYLTAFRSSAHIRKFMEMGRESLSQWGLETLYDFCEEYYYSKMTAKSSIDIVRAGSLLLSILRLGGYGRAFKFSSVAKSAVEPNVPDEFVTLLEDNVASLHRKACAAGFHPLSSDEWMIECLSKYGSTSSGMEPVSFSLKDVTGKSLPGRSGSKAVVGLVKGEELFSRNAMSRKTSIERPNKVGFRDVPIRATRGIFVVPMPTLNASIGIASHLMSYAGTRGTGNSSYGSVDAAHLSVGEFETTGVRVLDDWGVICSSGTHGRISGDVDLSEYDSRNVRTNWRDPINRVLKRIYYDDLTPMGPDSLTRSELVDFASGEGILVNSYWDNARKPFFFSRVAVEDGVITRFGRKLSLRPMPGAKGLSDITVWVVDCSLSEGITRGLCVGVALDGSDLFLLTSEASGEFTTLLFNGIMTLSIAQWIVSGLNGINFGRSLTAKDLSVVGDDIHLEFLMKYPPSDYDDFMNWIVERVSETGHLVNVFKTMICPYTANYRQTHALRGLYIPKDQVMTSTSEKSRAIFDPLGYLGSRRSIYMTRLTRGAKPQSLAVLLCLEYRQLMARRLKYSTVRWGSFESQHGVRFRRSKVIMGDRKRTFDVWRIRPSLVTAALPPSLGGLGLDPRNLLIFTSGGDFTTPLGRELLYIGLSMSKVFSAPSDGNFTHDLEAHKIYETLFTEEHRSSIRSLSEQGLDLGRLNAERIGERLLDRALASERRARFGVAGAEELAMNKLIASPLTRPQKLVSDAWMNCYSFDITIEENWERNLSPIVSMDSRVQILYDMYGISSRRRQRSPRDKLMSIVSREKHLRGSVTPEAIISLLRKLHFENESDRANALLVLKRLGFHGEIASEIFSLFVLNTGELLSDLKTGGACSDEVTQALGLMDPGSRPFQLILPSSCSPLEKYELSVRAAQLVLRRGLFECKKVRSIHVGLKSNAFEDTPTLRKFPKSLRVLAESKLLSRAVSDALRLDLCS